MNWFPFEFRVAWLFLVGACIGSFLNVCVCRIPLLETVVFGGSECRSCHAKLRWYDNIPLYSWLRLRGRCRSCGQYFSIRYFLVELLTGISFAALYWWEIGENGLYPAGMIPPGPPGPPLWLIQHLQLLSHLVLLSLMITASLIDLDSYQIPDEVTVIGTLLGFAGATAFPWSMLPTWTHPFPPAPPAYDDFLTLANVKADWPAWLEGSPETSSLWAALVCYLFWWFAVIPWPVGNSAGRKMRVVWAWLFRKDRALLHTIIGAVGSLAIVIAWDLLPRPQWMGLMTSLAGAAWGLGLVWLFRFVASKSMGMEALGFGDAMLMGMVGAFLGWQPTLLAFFLLAPVLGLVFGVVKWLSGGGEYIPYGPYLCLGALAVTVFWRAIWNYVFATFYVLGWMLPMVIVLSTSILAMMLLASRLVKYLVRRGQTE